jgi:dTDP-4-dehydrorhamnose reductase
VGKHPDILVTGAGGQVGRALARRLPTARLLSREDFDVRNALDVGSLFAGIRLVIHLAAMTDVDKCEQQPALCMEINGSGTKAVVEAAKAVSARVIYVSTDYVFDGTKRSQYQETDKPNPINAYGRSKLAGEHHVAGKPSNLIVRTSWVFGSGRNFVRSILSAADSGKSLRVVDDQRGRPTSAGDLADALVQLADSRVTGIVHVSGDGPICSWADLAEFVLRVKGMDVPVERMDSETYARLRGRPLAPRPANSAFSLTKARAWAVPLRDWRDAVTRFMEESS